MQLLRKLFKSQIYHQPLIADQIQLIVPSDHKLLDAVKSLDLYRLQMTLFFDQLVPTKSYRGYIIST
ncbi:hypothetical protein KHA80_13740 [Anaerobacillus sp. HL2]|nr:hypothetical protein KHA80_13740 [Anaerobacillus sp. HL2]